MSGLREGTFWEGASRLLESRHGAEGWASGLPLRLTRTEGSFLRRLTYRWRARQ